jgi:hypothetical protein
MLGIYDLSCVFELMIFLLVVVIILLAFSSDDTDYSKTHEEIRTISANARRETQKLSEEFLQTVVDLLNQVRR